MMLLATPVDERCLATSARMRALFGDAFRGSPQLTSRAPHRTRGIVRSFVLNRHPLPLRMDVDLSLSALLRPAGRQAATNDLRRLGDRVTVLSRSAVSRAGGCRWLRPQLRSAGILFDGHVWQHRSSRRGSIRRFSFG